MSTGVPAVDAALVWGGAVTVVGGGITVLWRVIRATSRLANRAGQFFDDWYGEEGRPGVPARPGVMQRLGDVEAGLQELRHEVRPNGGDSLRDAVNLANRRLARLCPDPDPSADVGPPDEPPAAP